LVDGRAGHAAAAVGVTAVGLGPHPALGTQVMYLFVQGYMTCVQHTPYHLMPMKTSLEKSTSFS
jgi:hypothetical protein